LLKYVAKKNKPMILSTGMASIAEIDHAIKAIEAEGNFQIVILHCISIYPPEMLDVNLNNIKMLQDTFGYPVGFSDHSIGTALPIASVALGACVIEKHFTIDKDLPGWDHAISANVEEMSEICVQSNNVFLSLGSYKRVISKAEMDKRVKFRRSLVLRKSLEAGHVIKETDLTSKRPGTEISPEFTPLIIGRTLNKSKNEDDLLTWKDFK
jgi:N-acetylneuraminate synthase